MFDHHVLHLNFFINDHDINIMIMIINRNFCSIFQMIFDVSCLYRTIFLSQDPTCIANGASYRFATRGDSCTASYYNCDSNNYAVIQSCPISQTGSYFNHITRQCESGNAPTSCSSVQAGKMIYNFTSFK